MTTVAFHLDGQRWEIPAEAVGEGEGLCPRCGATWVADEPELCGWCCRRWIGQQRQQKTLDLLEPEWEHEVEGWTRRLAVAVEAGRVTPAEAARAVARFMRGRVRGEAA